MGISERYSQFRIQIQCESVYYFVADDLPSIEAKIKTAHNFEFTFFAIHQVLRR